MRAAVAINTIALPSDWLIAETKYLLCSVAPVMPFAVDGSTSASGST